MYKNKRILKVFIFILLLFFIYHCSEEKKEKDKITAEDKKPDKVYKIAILDSQEAEPYTTANEEIFKVLINNKYMPGKNLEIIHKNIENNIKKGEDFIKEIVEKNPDIIILNGTQMAIAAKNIYFQDEKVRFIFSCLSDPVGIGVIEDFNMPPKYNFTGVSYPVLLEARLRFIKEIVPNVKKIGLIYSEMPQSISYRKWLDKALKEDEFKGLEIIYRSVPLITGSDAERKMVEKAKKFVIELDKKVDVFLGCNDQMCVQEPYNRMVWETGTKPLIGIAQKDVIKGWGATASIFSSHKMIGFQAANMVIKLLNGVDFKSIYPEKPKENGFAFDMKKIKKFNLKVSDQLIDLAGPNIVK